MRAHRVAALMSLLCACGPASPNKGHHGADGGAGGDGTTLPHTLSYVSVTPTNPIVELDLNAAGSQAFTATAVYADSTTEDVTSSATWDVVNPQVGTLQGATLAIPAFASSQAVVSKLHASYMGVVGEAQITVVAYRKTQDFFFVLPYQDAAGVMNRPLSFSTAVPALDVFFLMDTTGSMAGEIHNLQSALTGTIIPGIQNAVGNSAFGVGALEDFPLGSFGSASCTYGDGTADQPFKLLQTITSNAGAVQSAVGRLSVASGSPIGCGGDGPEAGLEAIYQAATGNGLTGPSPTSVPANHTGVGGVAFRQGTMPVIVAISDADSHGKGETGTCGSAESYAGYPSVDAVAHSRADAKSALGGICGRLVGISAQSTSPSANCISEAYFEDLATTTGARVPPSAWDFGTRPAGCAAGQCCTGLAGAGRSPDASGLCPLVFRANLDGTGVGTSIVTGIQMLTRFAQFTVTSTTSGTALPGGHTTAELIKSVVPASSVVPPAPPVVPAPTMDTTTFYGVTPGTQVGFTVNAFNDLVPQTDQPQIFRANIQVLAGGCTPLDQRDVLVLVPPMPVQVQ